MRVKLIWHGGDIYMRSGTALSGLEDDFGRRWDWGTIQVALEAGTEIEITQANWIQRQQMERRVEEGRGHNMNDQRSEVINFGFAIAISTQQDLLRLLEGNVKYALQYHSHFQALLANAVEDDVIQGHADTFVAYATRAFQCARRLQALQDANGDLTKISVDFLPRLPILLVPAGTLDKDRIQIALTYHSAQAILATSPEPLEALDLADLQWLTPASLAAMP
jgi:hypothetical protein